MDKIKIGENEYRLPVTIDSCEETYTCISDENCKEVSKNDMVLAINELAQLRAERDALKARVEELGAVFDAWWEHYSTQSSDKKQDGWGWIDEAWANLKQSVQTANTP